MESISPADAAEKFVDGRPPVPPATNRPFLLEAHNVSKRFCRDLKRSLLYGVVDIQREILGRRQNLSDLRRDEFWALQNINFQLRAGSTLGLVGLNGCGKTTLMRVLTGLMKPTTGQVITRGRMAPLLALGAGFLPVLTGRENVYTNMSVLGLTQSEINDRFDQVVEFAEIDYALDAPVQSYSSGMVARLGFACAICTQPDVMLIDEVLAVGDLKFREKCIGAIEGLRAKGTAMIMVHHSPDLLLTVCDQAIYLKKGQVAASGAATAVIEEYENDLYLTRRAKRSRQTVLESAEEIGAPADNAIEVERIDLRDEEGQVLEKVECGTACELDIVCNVSRETQSLLVRIGVSRIPYAENVALTQEEVAVLMLNSVKDGVTFGPLAPGCHHIRLWLPLVTMPPARYKVMVHIHEGSEILAVAQGPKFDVTYARDSVGGPFYQPRKWLLNNGAIDSVAPAGNIGA